MAENGIDIQVKQELHNHNRTPPPYHNRTSTVITNGDIDSDSESTDDSRDAPLDFSINKPPVHIKQELSPIHPNGIMPSIYRNGPINPERYSQRSPSPISPEPARVSTTAPYNHEVIRRRSSTADHDGDSNSSSSPPERIRHRSPDRRSPERRSPERRSPDRRFDRGHDRGSYRGPDRLSLEEVAERIARGMPHQGHMAGLHGLIPGLHQYGVIPSAGMGGALPSISALYDSRLSLPNGGDRVVPRGPRPGTPPHHPDDHTFSPNHLSSSRPYKSYPKEPVVTLSSPMDLPNGIPHHMVPYPNVDANTIASINENTEKLYEMYKNQLNKIQDLESKKRHRGIGVVTSSNIPALTHAPPPHMLSLSYGSDTDGNLSTDNSSTGPASTTTPGRKRPRSLPDDQKDEAYWERRRKNNEAAKRSRDSRRAKEDEIAIRAALLEQENLKLRVEVAALKTETVKLRCMLCTNP